MFTPLHNELIMIIEAITLDNLQKCNSKNMVLANHVIEENMRRMYCLDQSGCWVNQSVPLFFIYFL